jgi:hypothetical protein
MQKTFQAILVATSCVLLVASSCRRTNDSTSSTTVEPNATDLTQAQAIEALKSLKSTPQNFTVAAGVQKRIKGAEGTLVTFYPNSFKDKNGVTITSGNIDIQLTEIYKQGDMIANRTSTTTGDGVLKSGGEIDIRASKNGEEVFANKYGIGFKAAAPMAQPMELYFGEKNTADSITTWGIRKTGQGGSVTGTGYITDTALMLLEAPYFLFDSCTDFKLINCDHPYVASSAYINVKLVFPDNSFKNTYADLSLAFPALGIVTIMGVSEFNSSTHTMKFQGWAPTASSCKFSLIIPKTLSSFYYFEQSGVATDGVTLTANMTLLSTAEIKAKLKAL